MAANGEYRKYLWPANATAAVIAALAIWFVFVPVVYGMAVVACREIFPWFIWYSRYLSLAWEILSKGFRLPQPFLYLATFFAVRRLIGRLIPSWRMITPRPRRLHRILIALPVAAVMAVSGVAFIPLAVLQGVNAARTGFTPGRSVQRKKCSVCHSHHRPDHYIKEPAQWRITVDRMRDLEGAQLSDQEAETITAYLETERSYSDAWIFRARCLRCHSRGRITTRPKTAEEWELIINRAARTTPYAFRSEWTRQMTRYAISTLATDADHAAKDVEAKVKFEKACGYCHRLSLALKPDPPTKDWAGVVRRMAEKSPPLVPEGDIPMIADYMATLNVESKMFKTMFPHDEAIEAKW